MWTDDLFGTQKPIISMLHLDPLPGSPRYSSDSSVSQVVEHAKRDLAALQEGGVDGIIVSNEFDLPYQRHMSYVTPATMAFVVGQLKSELSVPYGVDAISDGLACLELAAACEARFIRGTFSGVYVGDGGLYDNPIETLTPAPSRTSPPRRSSRSTPMASASLPTLPERTSTRTSSPL